MVFRIFLLCTDRKPTAVVGLDVVGSLSIPLNRQVAVDIQLHKLGAATLSPLEPVDSAIDIQNQIVEAIGSQTHVRPVVDLRQGSVELGISGNMQPGLWISSPDAHVAALLYVQPVACNAFFDNAEVSIRYPTHRQAPSFGWIAYFYHCIFGARFKVSYANGA